METKDANVHVGHDVVVVRRKGSSATIVANVLGRTDVDGGQALYLDRLIHKSWETELGGYGVKGAISSILTVTTQPVLA